MTLTLVLRYPVGKMGSPRLAYPRKGLAQSAPAASKSAPVLQEYRWSQKCLMTHPQINRIEVTSFNRHIGCKPRMPVASFQSPYRKCLGRGIHLRPTLCAEAFPIKANDFSLMWIAPG